MGRGPVALGDGDFFVEVDVLDRVQELSTFGDRALERLTTGDEALAAGTLVDDGRLDGFGEVIVARGAAGVDQADATHVAIGDLVAGEVDRVIGRKVGVHALVDFAVRRFCGLDGEVAAVVLGKLLLDDVGADGDAEVVGLAGKVGGHVIIFVLRLKSVVAGVAPEDGRHTHFVGGLEGVGDFDDLAIGFGGAEVDRRPDGRAAHVGGLLDRAVHDLVADVRVGEQLVVVDLHHEGDLVGVATGDAAEDAESRADRVATAFDGELHNIFAVEVDGVLSERSAGGVLDALVDRQDGDVARVSEATRAVEALEVGQDAIVAVRGGKGVLNPISARLVDLIL